MPPQDLEEVTGGRAGVLGHVCADAEGLDVLGEQPSIPPRVMRRSAFDAVAIAVDLDSQSRFRAVKVEDLRADRMLPAKAEAAELAVFQPQPQAELRRGERLAHAARAFER